MPFEIFFYVNRLIKNNLTFSETIPVKLLEYFPPFVVSAGLVRVFTSIDPGPSGYLFTGTR